MIIHEEHKLPKNIEEEYNIYRAESILKELPFDKAKEIVAEWASAHDHSVIITNEAGVKAFSHLSDETVDL